MKVQKTKDYRQFQAVLGNRLINANHVVRLKHSFERKNLFQYNPIIVNEKMEIIDGQHRIIAAEQLGIDVYYVVAKGLGFNDIVLMNTSVKSWGLQDYLDSYRELEKDDYVTTAMFMDKWGLSVSNALAILSMGSHVTRAGYKEFKEGNFKIKDLKKSDEFAKNLRETAAYTTNNTWKDRDFIRALSKVYEKGIKHEKLISQLQLQPGPLHRRANVTDYLRQFEDVVNYNQPTRIRLY